MMRSVLKVAAALCLALAMAGCTRSPQVSFYTLGAPAEAPVSRPAHPAAASEGGVSQQSRPLIAVGPVTIPELVNRPQLVEQSGANQVKILESKRWAEPLKSGIPRYLAREIGRQLDSDRVFSYLEMTGAAAPYRVLVDISRFETVPGDSVTVEADWTIRHLGKSAKSGHSLVRRKIQGEGYDAVVAAFSAALSALGGEVAAGLQTLKP
ncbi:MAG TPA: PqiC family protein [Geomonas sp.]|nr:PqiC family protein [Geomonas sp.]